MGRIVHKPYLSYIRNLSLQYTFYILETVILVKPKCDELPKIGSSYNYFAGIKKPVSYSKNYSAFIIKIQALSIGIQFIYK